MDELTKIRGIGPVLSGRLGDIGVTTLATLAEADRALLTQVSGVSPGKADAFRKEAAALAESIERAAKEAKARKKKKARKKAAEKFEKELKKAAKKAAKQKAKKKARKSGRKKKA